MKRKNIIIVQNSLRTVYLFRITYIKKLLCLGYSVVIIAPTDDEDVLNELLELGCIVHKINITNRYSLIKSTIQMNMLILKYRLEDSVFICHFIVTFLLTYPSLVPLNKRLIVYTEGLGSVISNNSLLLKITKLLFSSIRGRKLYCNYSEKKLLDNGKRSLVTGGIGIDLPNLLKIDRDKTNKTGFKILYVGRLIADKGVFDAIGTLDYLNSLGIDAKLTLVGDVYKNNPSSMSEEDIEGAVAKYKHNIEFMGFVRNRELLFKVYQENHLLLLPSKREGFPVCVMEASICGCLSVVYDVPGCQDAVIDGENGFIVSEHNVTNYAKAVADILLTTDFDTSYESCKQVALRNFSRQNKDKIIIENINLL